jgi:glycosyltransferase involved in cell wall biosynthesis
MIGPVPANWGGLKPHGGVATHVQGLVQALPASAVRVRLLADNTDAVRSPSFPGKPASVAIQTMVRSPGQLPSLGMRRIACLGWRLLSRPGLRTAAPPGRLLVFLGQAANIDRFLAEGRVDLVHVHHAEYRQFLCQQVVGTSAPLVATVHSASVLIRPHPSWLVAMTIANYRRAKGLIAVSHFVRDKLVEHGADPSRMVVIPNGVDVKRFRPGLQTEARTALGLEPSGFVVLYTGGLVQHKGVDLLLQAFSDGLAHLKDARLVFVGTGPKRPVLERMAAELGIAEQVILAGYRSADELPVWYAASDVFALPSQSEGLSMSVLEAMSCGRPVITTRPGLGSHDAVRDGKTGILVRYGDVHQLSSTLSKLESSLVLRHELGDAARHLVEQEFDWHVISRKTVEMYERLLSESTASP